MLKLRPVARRIKTPAPRDSSSRKRLPLRREAIGYLSASSGSMNQKATAENNIFSRPKPMPMRRLAAIVSSGVPLLSPAVLKKVELRKANILTPMNC
jgi:hypothetical protein